MKFLLLVLFALVGVGSVACAAEAIVIDVGRQLFVDDYLIRSTNGVVRHWKKPVKDENPVVWPGDGAGRGVRDGGKDANLTCATDGGLWWDPTIGKYRLWYQADWMGDICYAESADGMRWAYPDLGIVKGTNRVFTNDVIDSWCVVPDYAADNPYASWKMHVSEPGATTDDVLFESADGMRFNRLGVAGRSGDRSTMYYDPFRANWVFSLRDYRTESGGRSRSYFAARSFGGSDCRWDWGCKGSDAPLAPQDWLAATNGPRWALYSFNAVAYESMMLGVMEVLYNTPKDNSDCAKVGLPKQTGLHFCFSRDGKTFVPRKEADIAPSGWGSGRWDTGYLSAIGGICTVNDDKLTFYYSGLRGDSTRLECKNSWMNGMYSNGSIGRATLRRDGFAGMVADGLGEIVTKQLLFGGEHFFVNGEFRFGSLVVEVLDEQGRPVPGFSAADCVPFASADKTKAEINWTGGNLAKLSGRPLSFRFKMHCGTLYAFWVSHTSRGESNGYVAAGGPDYKGLKDE